MASTRAARALRDADGDATHLTVAFVGS